MAIEYHDGYWISEAEKKTMDLYLARFEFYHMFLWKPEHSVKSDLRRKNKGNRAFAFIKVGRTRKMCFVDRDTKKAYKLDGYEPTWIEIKQFRFIRWARGMDL